MSFNRIAWLVTVGAALITALLLFVSGYNGYGALAGVGKFSVAERAARQGQHPRTGEAMDIPASRVPKFTAGSNLKQAVRR